MVGSADTRAYQRRSGAACQHSGAAREETYAVADLLLIEEQGNIPIGRCSSWIFNAIWTANG